MKQILIALGLFLLYSCSNKNDEEIQKLKSEFQKLQLENDSLEASLDNFNQHFISPFEDYQQILMNEINMGPDSIILDYNNLIKEHPNSFWSHEAKKRVTNIEKRRKLWYNKKWNLKQPENRKELVIPVEFGVISCPGC